MCRALRGDPPIHTPRKALSDECHAQLADDARADVLLQMLLLLLALVERFDFRVDAIVDFNFVLVSFTIHLFDLYSSLIPLLIHNV